MIDGLYILSSIDNSINCVENDIVSSVVPLKLVIPTYLWHLRLSHTNMERIIRLVEDGPLGSLKVELYPICKPCLKVK